MIGPVIFLSFAVFLLVGTPIAICLGVSSVFGMLIDGAGRPLDTIMTMLPRIFSSATSKFVLLAVPFFILGGNVMEKAGISERLINFAQSCVGHLRGGLIVVMVSVACFFAAISGSGPATVAALGMILIRNGQSRLSSGIQRGIDGGGRCNGYRYPAVNYIRCLRFSC